MDGSSFFELSPDELGSLYDLPLESPRLGTPFVAHLDFPLSVTDEDLQQLLSSIAAEEPSLDVGGTSCSESLPELPAPSHETPSECDAAPRDPFVACNNKMDLDKRWKHLEHLDIKELNVYIKMHGLGAADVAAIKQARRRAKNRKYSEDARKQRRERTTTTVDVHEQLTALRGELAQAQRTVARLSALVAQHGIVLPGTEQ